MVLTPYSLFVIEEKDKPVLHDFSYIKKETLEKELIGMKKTEILLKSL